mmetsp:Transcript_689/g.1886  ORF Transcript_689/g.1886 Transcript_689/m.1886 type:complete len:258 (-) Transcript_689:434-1207(-)
MSATRSNISWFACNSHTLSLCCLMMVALITSISDWFCSCSASVASPPAGFDPSSDARRAMAAGMVARGGPGASSDAAAAAAAAGAPSSCGSVFSIMRWRPSATSSASSVTAACWSTTTCAALRCSDAAASRSRRALAVASPPQSVTGPMATSPVEGSTPASRRLDVDESLPSLSPLPPPPAAAAAGCDSTNLSVSPPASASSSSAVPFLSSPSRPTAISAMADMATATAGLRAAGASGGSTFMVTPSSLIRLALVQR